MYKHNIVLLIYNKDVACILDQNGLAACETVPSPNRRSNNINANYIPSHEPFLPTLQNTVFYNCTTQQCDPVRINSITQVALPDVKLMMCHTQVNDTYTCKTVKYFHFKDIDKILFLSNNIRDKIFYLIDCLAYSDGGRVCHKKDDVDSHTKLVDTGIIARPNETSILSQEEFLCEEDANKRVNCDLNRYVPYTDGLKIKESIITDKEILLKTGASLILLKFNCIGAWCGYSGNLKLLGKSRRRDSVGRIYRCYYARKQQICKRIFN